MDIQRFEVELFYLATVQHVGEKLSGLPTLRAKGNQSSNYVSFGVAIQLFPFRVFFFWRGGGGV